MKFFEKISNPYDRFFKTRKTNGIPFIISLIFPDIKDIVNISSELNDPKSNTKFADNIIETKYAIYINEFQTGPVKMKDLYRFILYYALILNDEKYLKSPKPIFINIIYKDKVNKVYELEVGAGKFKLNPVSLKDYDGDKYLEIIQDKIEKGDPLTEKEKQIFQYIPLLRSEKSEKELLETTIKLLNKDKYLTDDEKRSIAAGQFLLAAGFSKQDEEELRRWIKLLNEEDVLDMLQEGLIELNIEKGRKEGIISVAVNMLKNNNSISDIIKNTGLTRKQIERLQSK